MKRGVRSKKVVVPPDIENCAPSTSAETTLIVQQEDEVKTKRIKKSVQEVVETQVISTKTIVKDFCDVDEKIQNHIKRIEEMRISADAPVDTMGCHMLADRNAEPKVNFKSL